MKLLYPLYYVIGLPFVLFNKNIRWDVQRGNIYYAWIGKEGGGMLDKFKWHYKLHEFHIQHSSFLLERQVARLTYMLENHFWILVNSEGNYPYIADEIIEFRPETIQEVSLHDLAIMVQQYKYWGRDIIPHGYWTELKDRGKPVITSREIIKNFFLMPFLWAVRDANPDLQVRAMKAVDEVMDLGNEGHGYLRDNHVFRESNWMQIATRDAAMDVERWLVNMRRFKRLYLGRFQGFVKRYIPI